MTMKLKVGRKGYLILPKAVREAVGIEEGDEVIVEIRDGIVLRPVKRKVNASEIRELLRAHARKLGAIKGRGPKRGEASESFLEEEFED